MTAVTEELRTAPLASRRRSGVLTSLLVMVATLLSALAGWPAARAVLAGQFSDPDDALRLVEVRAWLAGQSWYDVTAMRLDPPGGASMHWSRLVDVPNALLIRLFEIVATPATAEALDRIVLPTLLLAGLFAAMAWLATVLAGRTAVVPALVGIVLGGAALVLFQPGRIGHHAPETLLFVLATTAILAALDARRASHAATAGLCVALALALSLETLPLLAVLSAVPVALWVWRGGAYVAALRNFASGLALGLPVVFLATVAPDRWFAATPDAFGMAQFAAGMIAALGCLALAAATPSLGSPARRLLAAAVVGTAALLFVVLAYPVCLRGPFAGIDPAVRAAWLDQVVESQPLSAFLRLNPTTALAIALPVGLGLAGAVVAAARSDGTARLRWLVLAVLLAAGLALGCWQVRGFTSIAPLAVCGALPLVDAAARGLAARGVRFAALFALPVVLPFTSDLWAVLLPDGGATPRRGANCLSAEALAPLAALPRGRIVAPINEGAHLLVATPHDVFAAPYHRNNDGNRYVLDVFRAPPATAEALLAARQVTYVLTCPGAGETQRLAAVDHGGLAARLAAGDVPAFLAPVATAPTPWRVFAVRPPPR